MEFTTYRFKDCIAEIIDNRGRNPDKYYDSEKYPVIDNYLIKNELHPVVENANRFLSQSQFDNFLRGYVTKDDLLMTLVGNGIGNVGLSPNDKIAIVQNTVGFRLNQELLDSHFAFYYFKTINSAVRNLDRGASQPSVNRTDVLRLKIQVPTINTQKQIADILSTYDELIENNNKRIKLLEQMAENLYKEWFVRFRFPDYENAEFENGIPKGWEYVKFADILSFDRGISYSSEEIDCEDGLNLINLKNINAFGGFRRDGTKKYNGKYKETQVVKKGDLIIGVTDMTQDRRTVGAAALIPTIEGTSVISADLVKVVSDIPNIYLYCLCRYGFYSKYFSQFANGANVLHLKPGALLNKKVLLPTNGLIDSFVEKVSTIIELIDELNLANDNLVKQRDLLLPRLMSGKLEV